MLDKPSDIAVILGIVLLVGVTVGLFVTDITDRGATVSSPAIRNLTSYAVPGGEFTAMGNDTSKTLEETTKSTQSQTLWDLIQDGASSLLKIGRSWALLYDSFNAFTAEIGLNPAYVGILITIIIIVFAVVTWTWIRGST